MKVSFVSLAALCTALCCSAWAQTGPLLLQRPAISQTQIAFTYADDLWTVSREGGEAKRLVSGKGRIEAPRYSPDGKWIAYSCMEEGNYDVFVVPAEGGEPTRLTFHPEQDLAQGWTPDGSRVLFSSTRVTDRDYQQLFTIPREGGAAELLPLPSGSEGAYSPDGARLAYVPIDQWQPAWKNYRGGQTTKIWIADLADSSITKLPRENSNDRAPMWVGGTVYFLSDREGRTGLFAWTPGEKAPRKLYVPSFFDLRSASATSDAIVYDEVDGLGLYDLKKGVAKRVPVTIRAELPKTRPAREQVKPEDVAGFALSPSGKRALIQVRGEILSLPAEKGDARNLTQSPGVADRSPSWSPDGKWLAWLTDENGGYALKLRAAAGDRPEERIIALDTNPTFFRNVSWSPDSTKFAAVDKVSVLRYVDVATGAVKEVARSMFDGEVFPYSWSPDGKWIAYAKMLPNYLSGIFLYSVEDGTTHQVTDGMSDAYLCAFDRSGKYLYFAASTNSGNAVLADISSLLHRVEANVYAFVLSRDEASPLAPESDEETVTKDEKKEAAKPADAVAKDEAKPSGGKSEEGAKDEKAAVEPVKIDLDGLSNRIVAVPVPSGAYIALLPAKAKGLLLLADLEPETGPVPLLNAPNAGELSYYDFGERKRTVIATGVGAVTVAAKGDKILLQRDGKWYIAASDKEHKSDGELKVGEASFFTDPRAEWAQIYREAWRIQRDYLYDPKSHGVDLQKAEALYARFLPGVASRSDLNVLFREMTGWLSLGHTFINGGANVRTKDGAVGLLGADLGAHEGRYRIVRILQGENFNPELVSPLTRPGVKVAEGDYILEVNGRSVTTDREFFYHLRGTAGKQVTLRVGPKADGTGAHDEVVVPIANEESLRYRTWIETNRRKVAELSGGRLAYIHIPDTAKDGLTNFVRYYFAQMQHEGAVLDERFNHGGFLADYVVDMLDRSTTTYIYNRVGPAVRMPGASIPGPKVLVINEASGSGGDYLPWYFRARKAGTIVGTRTWGGLVGIGDYPPLMDGGSITAPRMALANLKGEMDVENIGVPPDIEVEQDPKLVRQGRDPQLERAVAIALEQLAKNPQPKAPALQFPDYSEKIPAALRRN